MGEPPGAWLALTYVDGTDGFDAHSSMRPPAECRVQADRVELRGSIQCKPGKTVCFDAADVDMATLPLLCRPSAQVGSLDLTGAKMFGQSQSISEQPTLHLSEGGVLSLKDAAQHKHNMWILELDHIEFQGAMTPAQSALHDAMLLVLTSVVVMGAYCVAIAARNRKLYGMRGVDAMPYAPFVRELEGLVRDGVTFTLAGFNARNRSREPLLSSTSSSPERRQKHSAAPRAPERNAKPKKISSRRESKSSSLPRLTEASDDQVQHDGQSIEHTARQLAECRDNTTHSSMAKVRVVTL